MTRLDLIILQRAAQLASDNRNVPFWPSTSPGIALGPGNQGTAMQPIIGGHAGTPQVNIGIPLNLTFQCTPWAQCRSF